MKPRLSIVIATVLCDHPFRGRPDLHIFDLLAETLSRQEAPRGSFELIVVDSMWATRGDWFKDRRLPFTVKHVSSFPNVWHAKGRCGANAQMNRGLMLAAGDCVFWGHENCMYPPHFVGEALRLFATGRFPIAWYLADWSYSKDHGIYHPSPIPYSMCGYSGTRCEVEHRAQQILDGARSCDAVPWQWYFTYSGGNRDLLMALKGWDTNLDGEGYVVDCDVGSRIAMTTNDNVFCMSKNFYLVEATQSFGDWSGNVKSELPQLKCNYALLKYNRLRHQTVGGSHLGGEELLQVITHEICEQQCECREQCKREDVIYPWVPKLERWRFDEWQELRLASSFDVDLAGVQSGKAPYDQIYVHEAV